MPDDLYSDGGDEESSAPEKKEKSEDKNTALLPKSFFPGDQHEVGDTCTIRKERILDDQILVSYVHKKKDDEEPEELVEETDQVAEMMD